MLQAVIYLGRDKDYYENLPPSEIYKEALRLYSENNSQDSGQPLMKSCIHST